jgi:hypothetical protein
MPEPAHTDKPECAQLDRGTHDWQTVQIGGPPSGSPPTRSRFPSRDHFAACNGTAPIEVSSGGRQIYRLSRRGNRRLNHAIHMAAVTQIRQRHSAGRACFEKKLAEGKTRKEALRALKRRISDAIFACLHADAQRAAHARGAGGQRGTTLSPARPAHTPRHRLFGQATPGPAPTLRPRTAPGRAKTRLFPRLLPIPPGDEPQVKVERPERSEDVRP